MNTSRRTIIGAGDRCRAWRAALAQRQGPGREHHSDRPAMRFLRPLPRRHRPDRSGLRPPGGQGVPRNRGFKVEMVTADHQNKPDVGSTSPANGSTATAWMWLSDVGDCAGRARRSTASCGRRTRSSSTSAATSELTGSQCTPEHGALDLRHLDAGQLDRRRHGERRAATAGTSSPPTTPSAMRWNATPAVSSRPPAARCSARPLPLPQTTDFSSFLLQAQAARPRCIGLANAGTDTGQLRQAGGGIRPWQSAA